MVDNRALEVLHEHILYFLNRQQKKLQERPECMYEFEIRFGRLYKNKEHKESFDSNLLEKDFSQALELLGTRQWDATGEQELVQYKLKRQRVRMDASGTIVENVIKKRMQEKTLVLPGFYHAIRLSLSSEQKVSAMPDVTLAWKKSRKTRTLFSNSSLSFHLTVTKTRSGKERQLEIETTPHRLLSPEETTTLAQVLVEEVMQLESAL